MVQGPGSLSGLRPPPKKKRRESMTQEDVAREFEGVVVSWESSQDKYWKGAGVWTGTKQAKKFGEDLSLSDYQEAAKVHPDPRRREKFKNVAQWMQQQGAGEDTRLSALL